MRAVSRALMVLESRAPSALGRHGDVSLGLTAQAIILSALRASSLLQSEADSKIRQTPGPSSRGLSLASASYLLHRRSQRSRRLLDRNSKGSTMLASNPKFRIQPLSRFAICHARYRLFAKRAPFGQRLRQLGQNKGGFSYRDVLLGRVRALSALAILNS
jgi:hypothetical protein